MVNYSVPEYFLHRVTELARNYPWGEDPLQRSQPERFQAWKANLRLHLNQLAGEAWAAGAAWSMGHQTEAKYIVVTAEQYEALKENADGEQTEDRWHKRGDGGGSVPT